MAIKTMKKNKNLETLLMVSLQDYKRRKLRNKFYVCAVIYYPKL